MDSRWHWLQQGDAVTHGTAALLLALSVASWVVILWKTGFLLRCRRQVLRSLAACWQAPDWATAQQQAALWDKSGLVQPLLAAAAQAVAAPAGPAALAAQAPLIARLTRGLRDALQQASARLQWGQVFLATVGAVAPFVGLLGTVWGIHHALAGLTGATQVTLDQLAAPVGEALVMTAAGLAVAIPAVLAYNLLGRLGAQIEAELEGLAHDLQALWTPAAGEDTTPPPSADPAWV